MHVNQVRIMALGGLDENGKNMYVVEVGEAIFVIEAGLKYPDTGHLGVEYIIPDFSYLIENQRRIKGLFITHAHDDVVGALPHLLKQIDVDIYTGNLTADLIEEVLETEGIKYARIHRIERNSTLKIAGVLIRTFAMTHSFPDNFGVAISTPQGAIVYTGEFIVDYDMLEPSFSCDLNHLSEIGKDGVLALLCESVNVERSGHTAPLHRITSLISSRFEEAQGRILISCYSQSMFRMMEIIKLCQKLKKPIFLHEQKARSLVRRLIDKGYLNIDEHYLLDEAQFNDDMEDVVVLISGNGKNLFRTLSRIALQEDPHVHFRKSDTIIVASPIVSGTEIEANKMENEIYKEDGRIYTLDSKKVLSMHPSSEDLKMMIYLFKPAYYMPVKGEYRHLYMNGNLALKTGMSKDDVILLENGQVALFENRKLKSSDNYCPVDEVLIDGKETWEVAGVVLKDREMLSTDGVMVVGVGVDARTKEIINGPDVQTRGLIYLKDAEHIIKEVSNITEDSILHAVYLKQYDNLALRAEIRDRISRYLQKETGKRPMTLVVIMEFNR